VLGGTFDPIHIGHLAAAEAAIECAGLDRVIFVPSRQPPHRSAAVASAEDRLEMTRLATSNSSGFAVSDLEVRRDGPSYTVDTLAELRRKRPDADLFLILGWDAARLFRSWHEPERVRELAAVVVTGRPGLRLPQPADLEAAGLPPDGTVLCLRPTPDVSASEVRRAVHAGTSIAGMVPAAVERYIAANGLYRG
jgi:nicotinate-nucleotide adenylyltransferase